MVRLHLRLPSEGVRLSGQTATLVITITITIIKPKTRFKAARVHADIIADARVNAQTGRHA